MAGVALRVRDSCCEFVDFTLIPIDRGWGMTGSTSSLTRVSLALGWGAFQMTGQAVLAKFLDGQVALAGWVEYAQRRDTGFCLFVGDGVDTQIRVQIGLRTKRETDIGNRTCICRLDTGHHTLDVIALVRFAPGVAVAPAT